jgi:hypothetical protein
MSLKDDIATGQLPDRKLPDPVLCRAMPTNVLGLVACLVFKPQECKYAGFLNDEAFCQHPDRDKIVACTTDLI